MTADTASRRLLQSPVRQAHHSALHGRRTVAATEPMPVLESGPAIHTGPATPTSRRHAQSSRSCRPKIFPMSNSSQNSRYLLIAFLFPLFLETVPACNTVDHLQILAHPSTVYLSGARHLRIGVFLELVRTSPVWIPLAECGPTMDFLEPLVFRV